MRRNRSTTGLRALAGKGLATLAWAFFGAAALFPAGCGGGSENASSGAGPVKTDRDTARTPAKPVDAVTIPRPAWQSTVSGLSLVSVESKPSEIDATLVLAAGSAVPSGEIAFDVCLPVGVSPQVATESYRVGKETLFPAAADAKTTATIVSPAATLEWKGYFRHWPFWRMSLSRELWEPIRDTQEPVEIKLKIQWTAPAESAGAAGLAAGVASLQTAAPMADLAKRMAINPDDIDRWTVARPPIKSGIAAEPEGPAKLDAQATYWARISVGHDAVYRLTPEALEAAGIAQAAERIDHLRVFSLGKPVPTLLAARPGDPAVGDLYFYGWHSTSKYDPERVYWVALDPQDGGPRLATATAAPVQAISATAATAIERVETVERRSTIMINHGQFLSIQGLRWLDSEMLAGTPARLGFSLFDPLPGQGSVAARFEFVPAAHVPTQPFVRPAGDDSTTRSIGVLLTRDEATTDAAKLSAGAILARMATDRVKAATLATSLPLALVADGPTTFDLRLDDPQGPPDSEEEAGRLWLARAEIRYLSQPALREGGMTIEAGSLRPANARKIDLSASGVQAGDLAAFALDPAIESAELLPIDAGSVVAETDNGKRTRIQQLSRAEQPKIAPMAWRADTINFDQPADYLVIANRSMLGGLRPLIEMNNRRLLKTNIVDVQSIYDYYSGGMLSPEAIRDYLGDWLRSSPQTAPAYVLLVGDASSDYLRVSGDDVPNFVPTYTFASGGDTWASDYWFACVAGEDALADFEIGRLSVNSNERLKTVMDKLEQYRTAKAGPWRARLGFVADNRVQETEVFREAAETMRKRPTAADYEDWRVYLDDMPLEDDWHVAQKVFARSWDLQKYWRKTSNESTSAIVENLNRGTSVMTYFGHGSPNVWADERIWLGYDSPNRDSVNLKTDGSYAFILNYTCNTGAFDYPMKPYNTCMAEDFIDAPGGGAIAAFMPSGPGDTVDHGPLADRVEQALFEDEVRSFGAITTLARARFAMDGNQSDYAYMFNLLGDPASELKLTQRRYPIHADPEAVLPGGEFTVEVNGVQPAIGLVQATISDAAGNEIWKSAPAAYESGYPSLPIKLPADTPAPQDLRVSLHGWNERQNADWIAGGTIRVARPRPRIASTAIVRQGDRLLADAIVENAGETPIENLALLLLRKTSEGETAISGDQIKLEPRRTQAVRLEVPAAAGDKPEVLVLRIRLPERLDAPQEPKDLEQYLVVAPPGDAGQKRAGFVPELCAWVRPDGSGAPQLRLAMTSSDANDPTTYTLAIAGRGGDALTTRTVRLNRQSSAGYVSLLLDSNAVPRRARDGSIVDTTTLRAVLTAGPADAAAPVDTLALQGLHLSRSRMRIVPGSIGHKPDNPTDGQTIWISFTAENAGDLAASVCSPMLYDHSPEPGDAPLPVLSIRQQPKIDPLGPGRSQRVTLRWDPIKNQGKQTIWVALNPAAEGTAEDAKEQRMSDVFYVKSKAELKVGKSLWLTRSEEEKQSNAATLHIVVANSGETDAHGVEVSFYRTRERLDSDLLGSYVIDNLPGKSQREVQLPWNDFDPAGPIPSATIRLIGSQQRITAVGGAQ